MKTTLGSIPDGYRLMTLAEVERFKFQLHPLMGQWDIIFFNGGKISGQGYGYDISEHRNPVSHPDEFGPGYDVFVIKVCICQRSMRSTCSHANDEVVQSRPKIM